MFLLTGYHPDVDLMRRAGIRCDDGDAGARSESGNVRDECAEPVHRRRRDRRAKQTGNIFIENGRFHGEKIIAVLAERLRGE